MATIVLVFISIVLALKASISGLEKGTPDPVGGAFDMLAGNNQFIAK